MKIAVFGHKTFPSRSGGVEVVVQELSKRMASWGHTVVCYDRGGGKKRTELGVMVCPVPTLGKGGLAAVTSSFFAAVMASLSDAQVVHIHGEGPAFWCWLPKAAGKRVIVTVHGLDWQREKWRRSLGKYYIHLGERSAVRFADKIVVLTECAKAYFEKEYGRNTLRISNGITRPEKRNASAISRWGLHQDGYLLYLGRLVPEKGIIRLIEAYRSVKTDKKLVIAGRADSEEYRKQLKVLSQGDERICFTGFVEGELLESLYSNAWAYVLPSELEGMPISLLEAMSYGNCCLVSDLPECKETAGAYALYFQKGNVQDLKEKLQVICDTPQLVEQYRRTAAEYVCGKYDWERVAQRTLELYQ